MLYYTIKCRWSSHSHFVTDSLTSASLIRLKLWFGVYTKWWCIFQKIKPSRTISLTRRSIFIDSSFRAWNLSTKNLWARGDERCRKFSLNNFYNSINSRSMDFNTLGISWRCWASGAESLESLEIMSAYRNSTLILWGWRRHVYNGDRKIRVRIK